MPFQDGALRRESNLCYEEVESERIDRGYVSYPEESILNLFTNEIIVKRRLMETKYLLILNFLYHVHTYIISGLITLLCDLHRMK